MVPAQEAHSSPWSHRDLFNHKKGRSAISWRASSSLVLLPLPSQTSKIPPQARSPSRPRSSTQALANMYFAAAVALFLGAASSALALPTPEVDAATAAKVLVKVDLPAPNNWLTTSRLYPSNLIAGYNAAVAAYDAESWNAHILEKCQSFRDCTSTASWQGTNSGSTGGRYWFGEVYRGGPTTAADYERVPDAAFGITNSQMYTIKA
ncbi:hypothetical protein RB595_006819 [Gaeumannomyces hyphopodioides]